jgi:hypothetical protein
LRRRAIDARARPRPANSALASGKPELPAALHPPAETPAEQTPPAQLAPPETEMLSWLSSADTQSGTAVKGRSMYCGPRPLPKSQNKVPVGDSHAVLHPPVHAAVAVASQLPFACAWQLP